MRDARGAALAAVDEDRLLDAEDPNTAHPEDARRWLAVYTELLAYKEGVLHRVRLARGQLSGGAAIEIESTDLALLESERDRFRRRLDFWRRKVRELGGGIDFDPEVRLIRHGGRAIQLTRREGQLLAFLLENPGRSFRPHQLAEEAWQASGLSSEQVRNYVVRLRRKLAVTDLPCTLVSNPGTGYCLKWSDPAPEDCAQEVSAPLTRSAARAPRVSAL